MSQDINDWGMEFIGRIDKIVNESEKEDLKEYWLEGDWEFVSTQITLGVFLTEEQHTWVEEFLSEI